MMMFKIKRFIIRSLLLLALGLPLQAQKEEKKEGGLHFTAIGLGNLPFDKIYYRKGKELVLIELIQNSRSDPYSLGRSSQSIELFTDNKEAENNEKKYKLIGKAPLVQGAEKMLFFLRSTGVDKEGVLPLRLFGLDDSRAKFPKSSYRFINFINVPLIVDFNKKRFAIKAGKETVKKLNLSKDGEFTPFIVRSNKKKMLAGTRLFSHADNREMVLIFPPKKGSKRLDIRFFSD